MSKSRGWRGDLKQSADAFERVVYPEIESEIGAGGGELLPVERIDPTDPVTQKLIEILDSYAGVDYLHKDSEGVVRGIASRVQTSTDYGSFTIRFARESHKPTEFGKRLKSSELNGLYPQITSQAYVRNGELLNVGLCYTQNLIDYILDGEDNVDYITNKVTQNGAAKFITVYWRDFDPLYVQEMKDYHKSVKQFANTNAT